MDVEQPERRRRTRWDEQDGPRSWLVALACFISHSLVCGIAFTVGIYYVVFLAEFEGSAGATALVGSLNFGTLCITGPISSVITNRWSCRVSVIIGGILASLGLILSSFATGIIYLMLTFGILTGLGFGLIFTPTVTVVGEHFCRWRSLAMGISLSGVGFGTFVYPFILDILIDTYGWRGSLLLAGGLSLNICVCGALMFPINIPLKDMNFNSTISLKDKTISQLHILKGLAMNLRFNLLCINTFLMCFGMSVFMTHMPTFSLQDVGLNEHERSYLLSAIGISGTISRILLGLLMSHPRVNPELLFVACYILEGLSTVCIPLLRSYAGLLSLSALFGSTMAAYGPVLSEVAWLYTCAEQFPLGYGCLMLLAGVGNILGAPVAGMLYEIVLIYPPSFYLGGGAIILSALVIIIAMQFGKNRREYIEEHFERIIKADRHLIFAADKAETDKLVVVSAETSV